MRILVVEDEIKIANSIKRGLEEENFAVDVAYEGDKGLNMAKYEEYDLIVLDIMLPGKDGFQILKTLRDEKNYTPVIILTARGDVEDKVRGLDLGADDYLPKPFSFDELLARINAHIRRNSLVKDVVIKVDNLVLDSKLKRIERNGEAIELTGKEFSLLEFLMRRKGGIVSESQIVSHIWDYDFEGFSNVVAVHIRNLRKKIDERFPKDKKLLHTIRGLGYKIDG